MQDYLHRYEVSAEAFLDSLARVYSRMDSLDYHGLLDSSYQFEVVPEEVDPDDPNPWWDLFEEMGIAGNMFSRRVNEAGQAVDRIRLTMDERANAVDNTPYPDKPSGEEWRRVTALVDLLVVVQDPNDPEGFLNFVIASNQQFVVRPARDDSTTWTIYKQVDQEPINKGAGTENASWGAVKEMFR